MGKLNCEFVLKGGSKYSSKKEKDTSGNFHRAFGN